MKKTKLLTSAVVLLLGLTTLTSCGGSPLELILSDTFDTAYIGETYNFGDYITKQDGVEYSIECYYQNYYEKREYPVTVDGLTFVPEKQFDVTVVATAKKGNEKIKKTVSVPVSLRGDPLDELLSSNGFSGWADSGWRKTITNTPMYLHNNDTNNQNSATSIICAYSGTNAFTFGATVLCLDNFRNLDYWTDKTWENAIISMWVYNPNAYDIEFQMRIVDEYNGGRINIDWGQEGNISCIAEKKPEDGEAKWSRIIFPLKKMGVNHTLYQNEDGSRHDAIYIKSQYKGPAVEGVYNYQYYVDGIDIVPHDYNDFYKSIDTRSPDKIEDTVVVSWSDYGLLKAPNYDDREGDDPTKVVEGHSSIHYTFDYAEAARYTGDPTYTYGASCMTLNGQYIWDDFKAQGKDLENAVLRFKVFNTSDDDIEFALRGAALYQGVNFDWNNDPSIYKHVVVTPGSWQTVAFSLRKCGIREAVKYVSELIDNQLTVKVQYKGVKTVGYTFSFYIDGIDIVNIKDYPDPIDTNGLTPIQNVLFNGWSEDGFTKEAYYGTDSTKVIEGSDSSIGYHFVKPSPSQDATNGLNTMTLNDASFGLLTADKSWQNSILQFYVYNPNAFGIEFGMYVYVENPEGVLYIDWDTSEDICPHVIASSGQWTQISFDLKKMGISEVLFYPDQFTVKTKYLDDTSIPYSYDFYVDGLDVVSKAN